MCVHIQKLKSKINLLNGHIGQLHDSGLFNSEETSNLSAPLVLQVQDIHNQILSFQAREIEVLGEEVTTAQTTF